MMASLRKKILFLLDSGDQGRSGLTPMESETFRSVIFWFAVPGKAGISIRGPTALVTGSTT